MVPASTTTTVSIADATNPQDGGNPGYGDQLTFTATVSPGQQPSGGAIPEYDQNGNRETVDFYDTVTGQYLGQGNLTPNDDGSATATWTGYAENWNGFPWGTPSYNLGVGGYSVIAVYGGNANFTGSQSGGAAMNVVGEPITITNAVVGDYFCYSVVYEGDDGVLQGNVSGLDGAGYTLNVDWGDGQSGGSGTQTFSFPKGGAFSVCHYYLLNDAAGAGTQTDNVTATVTASDGPGATTTRSATTNVTATIVNLTPTVAIVVENPPAGGLASVPSSQTFTVDAVVSDPGQASGENESYSYQWHDNGVAIGTGSTATVTAGDLLAALDSVTVTDGHGGWTRKWGYSAPPRDPVVSISETDTDTNQTVLGGNDAEFDIHIDAGTAGPDAADDVLLQYGGPVGRGDGLHLHLRPSGGDALGGGLYRDRRRLGRRHTGLRCHHPRHLRRFDCNGDGAVEQSVSMPACVGAAEATATVVHPCIEMTTDAVTDQVVSGKDGNGKLITTTVIVGQQINLRAVLPAGVNVTGEQWTIPGTNGNSPFAIEKYTQSRGGGIVTAFAAQDPLLQGASVQYYWIAGSNLPYQVQCTVTVAGGPPIVLIAAIRVNTPALTLAHKPPRSPTRSM